MEIVSKGYKMHGKFRLIRKLRQELNQLAMSRCLVPLPTALRLLAMTSCTVAKAALCHNQPRPETCPTHASLTFAPPGGFNKNLTKLCPSPKARAAHIDDVAPPPISSPPPRTVLHSCYSVLTIRCPRMHVEHYSPCCTHLHLTPTHVHDAC